VCAILGGIKSLAQQLFGYQKVTLKTVEIKCLCTQFGAHNSGRRSINWEKQMAKYRHFSKIAARPF